MEGQGPVDISAVVVNYRTPAMTARCVRQLKDSVSEAALEVLVVDSGSVDGSPEFLRQQLPDVRVLELAENRGYGRAVNAGASHARGKYLLILNSDIFVQGTFAGRLIEFYEQKRAGIVGPMLRLPDGSVQRSFGYFPSPFMVVSCEIPLTRWIPARHFSRYAAFRPVPPPIQEVDWVTGAFHFLSRKRFAAAGGFDEGFFMYYEDVDLCRRIAQAGFSNWYFPEVSCLHQHCASSARPHDEGVNPLKVAEKESALRYLEKYHPAGAARVRSALASLYLQKSAVLAAKLVLSRGRRRSKLLGRLETCRAIRRSLLGPPRERRAAS
jgi:N-acetylglucosaminyl-diphospho-decaprenol L-rhamnosyltransferase